VLAAGVVVIGFVPYALFATNAASMKAQSELGRSLGRLHLAGGPGAARESHRAVHPSRTAPSPRPARGNSSPASPRARAGTPELDSVPTIRWPSRVAAGTPLGELTIAAAGVEDDVVVQGTDELDLEEGPGHYLGTALPGEPGNVAIAGHRTTWLRPFYNLQALGPGDPIVLRVGQLRYVYGVVEVTAVLPSDAGVIGRRPGWWLTLTTCTPRYSAAQRLVVHAQLDVAATLRADGLFPAAAPIATRAVRPARPAGGVTGSAGRAARASGPGSAAGTESTKRGGDGGDAARSYRVTQLPSAAAVLPAVPLGVLVAWCAAIASLLVAAGVLARRHRVALLMLAPAAACCFEAYGAAARLLPGSW
jgi:sortase A